MLALCVFALTFILFYEARGKRLMNLWKESASDAPSFDTFLQHALTGGIVLVLGGSLLFLLRRSDETIQYSNGEKVFLALGLGLLLGTLFVSWLHVKA